MVFNVYLVPDTIVIQKNTVDQQNENDLSGEESEQNDHRKRHTTHNTELEQSQ